MHVLVHPSSLRMARLFRYLASIINFIVSELMQVPLGIILKNENKIDEMVAIMSELHQYIPTTEYATTCTVLEGKLTQKKH